MKYAITAIIGIALFAWMFSLCSPAGVNKTGHEYMPDMYHPVSYEANQYSAYSWNHWDDKSTFTKAQLSSPRAGVQGTIPRGMTGVFYQGTSELDVVRGKNAPNAIAAPVNGHVPFYFENNESERVRCEQEMTANPFPITKDGLNRGKNLYTIYCGICHGDKGDGQGYLVSKTDAKYLAQPKNLIIDEMIGAGNGRYYFGIMYGRNVMGAYAEKLSFEERWQVIHYIRSMQAATKGATYDEMSNTLSNIEQPAKGTASGPARAGNSLPPVAPPPPPAPGK